MNHEMRMELANTGLDLLKKSVLLVLYELTDPIGGEPVGLGVPSNRDRYAKGLASAARTLSMRMLIPSFLEFF